MELFIFDIDHTLLKGATGIYFIKEGLKRKYFSLFELLRIPIVIFKYRLGFLKGSIVEREIPFMKGMTKELLEDLGKGGFENYGINNVFEQAATLIKELQSKGVKIIFATSSFDYSVKPVADYFGVEDVISSAFEFSDGCCTGFIEDRQAFGDSKRDKVLTYLQKNNIDRKNCTFYSDSHHDIPLLEVVGKAVAVNPDRKLRSRAKRENWPIIRFSKTI